MELDDDIQAVLEFWFGDVPGKKFGLSELVRTLTRYPYWYGKAFSCMDVDRVISERFSVMVAKARQGELDEWKSTREGRLALILLLDQIPRNIYRNTREAFATDRLAFELAELAIAEGDDRNVHALVRTFYYFPIMHREQLDAQQRSVSLCRRNILEASFWNLCNVVGVYFSARRHHQIIKRFGRYPHRNAALGRLNTEEESRFLKQPFSSF